MILYVTPDIPVEVWPNNVFPVAKYELLHKMLFPEGVPPGVSLTETPLLDMEYARLAHSEGYCRKLITGELSRIDQRRIGFPWSENLFLRARYATGGTLAAAETALDEGISGVLAGGTHHAHVDFGFGFCVLNDLAIAAKTLLARGKVARIAVVDLDFHPGDGTADICKGDEAIYTMSIHGRSVLSRDPIGSTVDVELSWGIGDAAYLEVVKRHLKGVKSFSPDLVIYQAGADVLAGDSLGRFKLSLEGVRERDRLVFDFCTSNGYPVAFTLGGGYHTDVEPTVRVHAGTVLSAIAAGGKMNGLLMEKG